MSPAALSAILLASLLCAAQASSSDGSCGGGGGGGGGCLHGSSCVQRSGGVFSCSCPSTHIGEFCEQANPCLSSPCSPSRTCSVRTDGNGTALFECSCPTGWSGEQCQVAVDVCSVVDASAADSGTSRRQAVSITCLHGGTCVVTAGGSQACRCPVGFSGPRCDVEDECAVLRPCQHSGTCLNTPAGYRCKCSPLYTGNNCERVFMPCQPSPCSNGGACNVTGAFTYSCTCPAGFGGTHCEQRIGNCSGHRCANGARCLASTGTLGYSCQCPPGYTGTLCTEGVDECRESPCLNGATCRNTSPGHACSCARGWIGDRCQNNIDDCASSPCQNGGTCHDGIGSYRCECTKGWTGQSCQLEVQCLHGLTGRLCDVDINECSKGPCQNNGTCIDQLGRFHCVCSQGFDGTLCERNVNECLQLPCRNGATCRNRPGSYACECAAGFEGRNCDINVDDCRSSPCRNGGTCVDKVNGYACRCRSGYFGRNCSSSGNAAAADCLAQPCHSPGTASCRQHADGYQCLCKDGWRGRWCGVEAAAGGSPSRQAGGGDVGACSSRNPCQNGGRCVAEAAVGTAVASASSAAAGMAAAARCRCPARFTGRYCEVVLAIATPPCSFHSCSSGSTCSAVGSHGYQCLCPPGSHGSLCEVSSSSSRGCHSGTAPSPCGHNALSCQDAPGGGGVVCQCKANWSGVRCQTWSDPGEGKVSPQLIPTNSTLPAAGHCTAACTIKASNGQCDIECNSAPCLFDGSDCQETARTVPWSHCSAMTTSGKPCRDAFNDGTCDGPCNVAGCLYDGFDCLQPRKVCDPTIESYCKLHYANGYCDRGCYNEECGWDGLDCLQQSEVAAGGNPAAALARGELHVVVLVSPREFLNRSGEFLLTLGRLLRTVVKLKADEHARPLVVPWTTVDARGQAVAGTLVTLTLDNSKCAATGQQECFETAASAAEFVAAALHKGWTPGLGIGTVSASSTDSSDRPNAGAAAVPTYVYLVAGAVVLVIVAVLVGAYFGGRRKRARGITWFPEGFAFSSSSSTDVTAKRKCPEGEADGEDLGDAKLGQTADEDDEGRESPEPLAKKHCGPVKSDRNVAIELLDKRAWNARHYDACLKSSALTPPRHDEQMPDANCRGPSGITPLMLAATSAPAESCRSLRSVTSTSEGGSNQSAEDLEALTELIDQGANIRERDDRGETALHHAARCGRADEARFLLDKGSDPNAKDLTGRTPLHAAVAADAYRVFQTLLRDRRTNLNERTHDGATAMILAARLAVDDMVAELIQSKADVNATDEHGKTALHWAAAVNNVAAATMLLKFGVNCDVQDDQEQTPLHLAAKEGSYEVATMLVSYGASLDIADCQERLPEDLALERHHRRLVALLQQQQQHCGQQMEASFGLVAAGAAAAVGSGARRLGSKKRCHRSGRLGMAAAAAAAAAANGWWRANGLAQPPTAGTLPTTGLLLGGEEALPLFVGYMHSSQPDREASRLAGLPGGGRAGFGSLPMASFDGSSGGDGRGGALGPMQQAYDLASGSALSGAGKAGNGSPLSPYSVDYGRGGGWPSDASSQSAFGSRTLPVKQQQQLHLRHDVRLPSGFVLPGWRGAGTGGSFGRQPSAASADCRLPFIEGQPGGGGGSHERAGLSASDRAHAAAAAGSFASADDPPACRWGGRGRVRSAATAPTAADALDSIDGACATTPSPDSGTGWSSDCSGFSPQACGGGGCGGGSASASCAAAARGSHYCTSCNVASSRPDRLSSLSNGSPHSDWSDCISPIEPSSCVRHDSVFA